MKQEREAKLKHDNEDQLKKEMAGYIAQSKEGREAERQECKQVLEFLEKDDVKQMFDKYE